MFFFFFKVKLFGDVAALKYMILDTSARCISVAIVQRGETEKLHLEVEKLKKYMISIEIRLRDAPLEK